MSVSRPQQVVIVGGGIAGMAAAALAARTGHRVTLVESRGRPGGRSQTADHAGYRLNLGAHALYLGGPGRAVLRDLGVDPTGGTPQAATFELVDEGRLVSAAGWGARHPRVATALAALVRGRDARPEQPLDGWLDAHDLAGPVRAGVLLYVRTAAYANDPARYSAAAASEQVRLALRGVRYLDNGWQTIVDGLHDVAVRHGAHILTTARAEAVLHDERSRGVRLADGTGLVADHVVVAAGGPRQAARLLAGGPAGELAARWWQQTVPVRAATLDLALSALPRRRTRGVLALQEPLYLSVHSRWAGLAPQGGAVVHLLRYHGAGAADPARDRGRLEALAELALPGWRDVAVHARFLPDLTVAHSLPLAAAGGLLGRPAVAVEGVRGLTLAGDWVGPRGQLSDAALASAHTAVALIGRETRLAPTAPAAAP